MNPEQLHILQHALGCNQYGRREHPGYDRNHYVGGVDECRTLVSLGYMTEHKASDITGGDPLFTVTTAGRIAMEKESPSPPKITRSQQRMMDYRDFSDAYDCTFKDFLKIQTTQWYKDIKDGKHVASILGDYL